MNLGLFLLRQLRHFRDLIVLMGTFIAYHAYDGLCYAVSNIFPLAESVLVMCGILFLVSVFMILLHSKAKEVLGWDILGLEKLNLLREDDVPKWCFWKRLLRWIMNRTVAIYCLGPLLIGPPVVALLLRKKKDWGYTLGFYVIPGTLLSVFFWVPFMKGLGFLTWESYIKPLFD